MEKPDHNIDEIFRQRLYDVEAPPPAFVWNELEAQLRKRKRRAVWWWISGAGILLLLLFFRLGSYRSAPVFSSKTPVREAAPVISDISTKATQNGAIQAKVEAAPAVALEKEPIAKPAQLHPKGRTGSNIYRAERLDVSPMSPMAEPPAPMVTPETNTTRPEPVVTNAAALHALQQLAGQHNRAGLKSPTLLPAFSKSKKAQPRLCYDFSKNPSAWLLDVYVGPSIAQRSLTSTTDNRPYLQQRLATEHQGVAANAGLRASLMFNRNFLLRTGVQYDQVTEVFEYIDPTYVEYIIKVRVVNGRTITDTLGVEYGENYQKVYNRYAMVDVPLMVGMEMRKGRTGFSVNAGISANILFYRRGAVIDPDTGEPGFFGSMGEKPEKIFRTNLGISANASIQCYWHLTPRMRLFVEPSVKQILQPVSLKTHPVEHRYSIFGLRLGATKIL